MNPDLTPYPTAVAYTDDAVYFEREGEILRAPFTNPINPDGFPSGRWECSRTHWDRFSPVVHANFATILP